MLQVCENETALRKLSELRSCLRGNIAGHLLASAHDLPSVDGAFLSFF